MQTLSLPKIDSNIRKTDGKVEIFDIIRKKYVILQPEEWVRQHMVHYLIRELHYPKSHIKIESGLLYNRLQKRSDILILDNEGQNLMLVECKTYKAKITQSALDQVTIYNKKINAKYILITNGLNHYCCELSSQGYSFLSTIPVYKKSLSK